MTVIESPKKKTTVTTSLSDVALKSVLFGYNTTGFIVVWI